LLRAWSDAPAFLLSCPGPLRRHHAAAQPISQLSLPQCLLGGEAQLRAFAASLPDLTPRLFFVPLPELFSGPASQAALHAAIGESHPASRLVHLRFGGTRSARIMKEARNGLVLAENHRWLPITASRHPFASGLVLPAHMRRVFAYDEAVARPSAIDGKVLPLTPIGAEAIAADLPGPKPRGQRRDKTDKDGFEVVSLAEFRSNAWAAGPVRARSPHLRAALAEAAADGAPFVLLPWNLDHPGSTVPALIERTLRLQSLAAPALRLLVLPFNYPGQTGLIRRMIRQLRGKTEEGADALPHVFIGRLTDLHSLPDLLALSRVAWVDGNDPEFDWTARRLAACGIAAVVLAAGDTVAPPGAIAVESDEELTLEAETAFGLLHFRTQIPSLRSLRKLLAITRGLADEAPRKAGRRRSRA
jgi:hypothetical protein